MTIKNCRPNSKKNYDHTKSLKDNTKIHTRKLSNLATQWNPTVFEYNQFT